jgi:uncharacterized cysteine cluster protein YcgN (CxxCxxCC family)
MEKKIQKDRNGPQCKIHNKQQIALQAARKRFRQGMECIDLKTLRLEDLNIFPVDKDNVR